MMIIENVLDQQGHNTRVTVTHEIRTEGRSTRHFIRFYSPNPAAGPLAGKLIASYVLTPEQAGELKAHL